MSEKQTTQYTFAFLEARESTFIKSLLSVYKNRAKSRWLQQDRVQDCDVIFLGTSFKENESYKKLNIQSWQSVIFYGSNDVQLNYSRIYRIGLDEFAGNILEAIEKCEDLLVGDDPDRSARVTLKRQHLDAILGDSGRGKNVYPQLEYYRLARWPSASLMQKNKEFAVLAALLINRELTFDDLVRRSGGDAQLCSEFLELVKEHGDVTVSAVSTEASEGKNPKQVEKLGLFDKIRHRLGLRVRAK